MATGVEKNEFIEVPAAPGIERPPQEGRFRFRLLTNDRVEVHHPFHSPTILGNGSEFEDASMDAAAVVLFQEMPFLADSRKLNRIQRFETRPFAGEYSQLSHCFSLGVLAVDFAGGPLDILDALYNDASQTYDGHQGDDNYQGHGSENLHDYERASFLARSGIVDALIVAEALRRHKDGGIYVGKSRLSIERLLSEDEVGVRRSFLSNKHKERRMDADRFQYNEEERMLINYASHMDSPDPNLVALALADQALDSISRRIVLDDNEGDQLAFTDDMVALESGKEYVRSNSEHWNEPVQDVVNDDLNLAERYFFVCDHPHARNYQQFYPRDYLHTSASLMIDQFDIVAKDDPVMAWFLNTAEGIAKHQRAMHLYNRINHIPYTGPIPPEGVNLKRLDREAIPNTFDVKDNQFNIELPKGKVRTINPRVILNGGGSTTPLSVIHPEYIDYATQQQQWIGDYQASIAIEDPKLAEQIKRALDRIRLSWRNALDRPFMPPSELQRIIQNANSHVRKIGAISLNSANGLRYK